MVLEALPVSGRVVVRKIKPNAPRVFLLAKPVAFNRSSNCVVYDGDLAHTPTLTATSAKMVALYRPMQAKAANFLTRLFKNFGDMRIPFVKI